MHLVSLWLGLIYFISEVVLGLTRRAPKSENVREADASSLRSLWIVIMLSIFAAIQIAARVPTFRIAHFQIAVTIGIALFVIGLVVRWWAIITLGRFFTVNVAIARDHQLVDHGPYRLVRHPSYTGVLLAFLGFGLSLGSWLALAVLLVPIFLVFLFRMNVEERALREGLGEKYVAYLRRTKRLLPFLY